MATLRQKIAAEQNARAMLDDHGLPQPDEVEYGQGCIRLLWHEEKTCLIVEIDKAPPGLALAEVVVQKQQVEVETETKN